VKVGGDASQIEEHLKKHVEGTRVSFCDSELAGMRDEARLRKLYKVESANHEAEAFVIGSMALKGL